MPRTGEPLLKEAVFWLADIWKQKVSTAAVWVAVSKPEEIQKQEGGEKKLLLAQITHSFKLTMLNVHHVTVCMKCKQNILGLGIHPPPNYSLFDNLQRENNYNSVAAIFRSLHGSRVRPHCICASVRPAGSPPVSQIVILKTLFSFWRVEQAVGSQTVHVASENWFGEAKKRTPGMQCDSGLFI